MKQETITKQKKKLPEGWKFLAYNKLILKEKTNHVKKYKVTEYLKEGEYPIIDQSKEIINGYTNNKNDVLDFGFPVIIFGDHTLNIKYIDFSFARGADGTQIIIPNKEIVLPKYFYYHLLRLNIKVTLYERYFKYVKKSLFLVPPLPEQQKIVSKLDKQMAQIEVMKKEANEQFYQAKIIYKSLLIDIFKRLKEEKVITKYIGEIANHINGRGFKKVEWSKEGIPIIRIQNLNDVNATFNYYNGDFDEKILVKKGDLLFSWSGTVGSSFGIFKWNRKEGLLNQHIYKVKLIDPSILEDYYVNYMEYYISIIEQKAHGGVGLKHITKKELEQTEIPIPSKETQRRRIKEIKNKKEEIKILNNQIKSQIEAINQLPASMLNDMFGKYEIPEA